MNQPPTLNSLIQLNARETRARHAAEHVSACLSDILSQALTVMGQTSSFRTVVETVLKANAACLKADGLSFWREAPDGEGVTLQMMYAFGDFYTDQNLADVGVPRTTPKDKAPTWSALVEAPQPFTTYDIEADPRITLKKQILDQHVKRMLVVPLLSGQTLLGWSSFFHLTAGEYSEDDIALAYALSQQATFLAEMARHAAYQASGRAMPSPPPPRLLTSQELKVLALIAEDKSTKEIAAALAIKDTTAKAHVKNIFEKLDANRRGQAVLRARALGLLPKL